MTLLTWKIPLGIPYKLGGQSVWLSAAPRPSANGSPASCEWRKRAILPHLRQACNEPKGERQGKANKKKGSFRRTQALGTWHFDTGKLAPWDWVLRLELPFSFPRWNSSLLTPLTCGFRWNDSFNRVGRDLRLSRVIQLTHLLVQVLYPILSPKYLSPARPRPGQPRSIKQLDRKSPQKSFKILSNYSLGRPPQINKWNDFSIPGAGAFGAMPVENTPLMNQLERFEW